MEHEDYSRIPCTTALILNLVFHDFVEFFSKYSSLLKVQLQELKLENFNFPHQGFRNKTQA